MRLIQNAIQLIKGKIFKLISSYLSIQLIKVIFMMALGRFISLGLINTLITTLIDSMLFVSVYRIIFENRSMINSYQFDNSNLFVFIGYINLNFVMYLISYVLGFAQGASIIAKIILIASNFILIFVPMLGLKGNTSLFSSARESVNMIQEDSNDLLGLFIIFVFGVGLPQFIPNYTSIYFLISMLINFNIIALISEIPVLFRLVFGGVVIDIIVMLATILSMVMIQKHCEYR